MPFVTIFKDSVYDESDFINLIEKDFDIKIKRNVVDKTDLTTDNLIKSIKALDFIWSEPCLGHWLHYKKINEQGYNVCIEGHGVDEILGGYEYHYDEYIKTKFLNNPLTNLEELNKIKRNIENSENSFNEIKIKDILKSFLKILKCK